MTGSPAPAAATPAAGLFFNVTLNAPVPRIERTPITIRVGQVVGSAISAPRASSPIAPVRLNDVTQSTPANCFLQLWEMDEYRVSTYRADEETDRRALAANRLIVAIPGILVRRAAGVHEFQLINDFERPAFDRAAASENGFVRLKLRDAGDTYRILNIAMPEFEYFFELGACLRLEAADLSYSALRNQPPFQVRNEIASIRRQVAQRGGITVAVAGNWRTGTEANGNPQYTNNNDAEFERQAEDNLDTLPGFIADPDRQAKIGYHIFNQPPNADLTELAGFVQASRQATGHALAQNELFLTAAAAGEEEESSSAPAPSLDQCPRMSTLLIYAHGWRNGMTIAGDGTNSRQTRVANIANWVPQIAPHATQNLVVTLYACNCGRGNLPSVDGHADPSMGKLWPCEEPGADSFAWTLHRTLRANNIAHPCVWGHTTAAHACRNPFLRVFTNFGHADGVNLILQNPRVTGFGLFIARFSSGDLSWIHRGNLLRELCTYHACYFDFAYMGSTSTIVHEPWYTASLATEASLLMQELVEASDATATPDPEHVVFADATRRYITATNTAAIPAGAAGANFSPDLTRVLKLRHFPIDAEPFSLSVRLVKAIQLISDRISANATNPLVTIQSITDDGDTAVIKAVSASHRAALVTQANAAITQGFLATASSLPDHYIQISVSATQPTPGTTQPAQH